MSRQYTIVEERYLAEYIAKYLAPYTKVMYQVPVSAKPWQLAKSRTDVNEKWFFRFGPRIDAVVIKDGTIYLIEAETRRPVNGLSELEIYAANAFSNPQLRPYEKYNMRIQLVTPIEDEHVMVLCKSRGWDYVLFKPDWINEHLRRWGIIE